MSDLARLLSVAQNGGGGTGGVVGPNLSGPNAPPPFPEPPPQPPQQVNCMELVNQRLEPLRQRLQERLIEIDSSGAGIPQFAREQAKAQLREQYIQQARAIEADTRKQCEEENRRRQAEYKAELERWNYKKRLFFEQWTRDRQQREAMMRSAGAGPASSETKIGQANVRCSIVKGPGNVYYEECYDAKSGKLLSQRQVNRGIEYRSGGSQSGPYGIGSV